MYVCICNAVTDKQIRRAAARGVDSLYELRESLGVATGCGSCGDVAAEILAEYRGLSAPQPQVYVPALA